MRETLQRKKKTKHEVRFNEEGKTIVVSREEVEFVVTPDMTDEERDRFVFDYLNEVKSFCIL